MDRMSVWWTALLGAVFAAVRRTFVRHCWVSIVGSVLFASAVGCSGDGESTNAPGASRKIRQAISEVCDPEVENCCPDGYSQQILSDNPDVYSSATAKLCVRGGDGPDTIMAGPQNLVIGGDGDDVINLYQGGTVIPGPGADQVSVSSGATVQIYDQCEAPSGEILWGGGDGTLVTPVPRSVLEANGVTINGFANVKIEQNSCKSQCVEKPDCSGNGVCAEGARAGEVVCRCKPGYAGKNCEKETTIPNDAEALVSSVEVGRPPGEPSVDATGSFKYNIPIEVPAGRAGMQPNLSFAYSSSAGNGLMGVGWNVTGISSIARCGKTVAREGKPQSVRVKRPAPYDQCPQGSEDTCGEQLPYYHEDIDNFCLDGQKLMHVGGSLTEPEFRTEQDTFAKIIAKYDGKNWPSTFTVWRKDGRIEVYAAGAEGTGYEKRDEKTGAADVGFEFKGVVSWHLSLVRDRFGNNITYSYEPGDAVPAIVSELPSEILYTGCSDGFDCPYGGPTRLVKFVYRHRPDYIARWVAGLQAGISKMLDSVDVYTLQGSARTLVRQYKMSYGASAATFRSRLDSIRACDGANKCLSTDFQWGKGERQNFRPTWHVVGTDPVGTNAPGQCPGPTCKFWAEYHPIERATAFSGEPMVIADFDGNGTDDLLVTAGFEESGSGPQPDIYIPKFLIMLSRPSGKSVDFDRLWLGKISLGKYPQALDLEQDGQVEILDMIDREKGIFGARRWNSSTKQFEVVSKPDGQPFTFQATHEGAHGFAPPAFMDVTGDGILDGFFDRPRLGDPHLMETMVAKATRGTSSLFPLFDNVESVGSVPERSPADPPCRITTGDHAGNGAATFVRACPDLQSRGIEVYRDLNGDGLSDIVHMRTGGTAFAIARISTGINVPLDKSPGSVGGTGDPHLQALPPVTLLEDELKSPHEQNFTNKFADFNADGLTDIGQFATESSSHLPALWLTRAHGPSIVTVTKRELPLTKNRVGDDMQVAADFNGDGLQDVMFGYHLGEETDDGGEVGLQFLIQDPSNRDDIITKVTSSSIVTANVTYTSAPLGELDMDFADRAPHCSDPQFHCPRRGFNVVSAAEFNRGGALESYYYYYDKPAVDVAGRGMLGFGEFTVLDRVRARRVTTRFDHSRIHGPLNGIHSFPFASVPSEIEVLSGKQAFYNSSLAASLAPGSLFEERSAKTVFSNALELTNSGKTYFVKQEGATETYADSNGVYRTVTRTQEYDSFGNVTFARVDDAQITITTRHYEPPDTANWLINKLSYETTTSTRHGDNTVQHRTTKFRYGEHGELKGAVEYPDDPELQTSLRIDRDGAGLVRALFLEDQHGNKRAGWVDFSADGVYAQYVRNGLGHYTWAVYHPGLGVPLITEDTNGVKTKYKYDGFGRLAAVLPTKGPITNVAFVPDGTSFHVLASQTPGATTKVKYDDFGRVEYQTQIIEGRTSITDARYDRLGRVRWSRAPYFTDESPTAWTTYEYDNLDELRVRTNPDGSKVESTPDGALKTEIIATAEKVRRSIVHRQVDGMISSVVQRGAGVVNRQVSYQYGPSGVLRKVIEQGGPTTEYEYDARGNRIKEIAAETGTTILKYTGFGQVRQMDRLATDPPIISTWEYDEAGRTTKRTTTGEEDSLYTYDVGTGAMGQLTEATSPDGVVTSYTYTSDGLPHEVKYLFAGEVFKIGYDYDAYNRPERVSYPEVPGQPRFALDFSYDDLPGSGDGSLKSVKRGSNSYWEALKRLPTGLPEFSMLFGWYGQQIATDPNTLQVSDIIVDTISAPLFGVHYDYHSGGNIKARVDSVANKTESYTYDAFDQLESWTQSSGETLTNTYDLLGNHKGYTGISKHFAERGYTAHQLTRLESGGRTTTYEYDQLGRQTKKLVDGVLARSIEYTSFDLPRKIATTGSATQTRNYRYDAAQRRFFESNGQTSTTYVGDLYERRVDAQRGVTEHVFYVFAGGARIGQVTYDQSTGTETVVPLLTDLHGSVLSNVNQSQAFTPWGERAQLTPGSPGPTSIAGTSLGFTGHLHDDDVGLINMRGRMYDPEAGTFLSVDPVVSAPGNVAGWNPYAYVLNNPLKFVDPTGFAAYITDGIGYGWSSDGSHLTFLTRDDLSRARIGQGTANTGVVGSHAQVGSGGPQGAARLTPPGPPDGFGAGSVTQDGYAAPTTSTSEAATAAATGFVKGASVGVGMAYALGALAGLGPVGAAVAVGVGVGLATYAIYELATGGAQQLWSSGERIAQGTGSAADYEAIGAAVGGLASAGAGKGAFQLGAAMTRAARGTRVLSGMGDDVADAVVLREIAHGERIADILDEVTHLTRTTELEHSVLSLADGRRVIAYGGRDGIDFAKLDVRRILGHSHPPGSLPGPSIEDAAAMQNYFQRSSWLLEVEATTSNVSRIRAH